MNEKLIGILAEFLEDDRLGQVLRVLALLIIGLPLVHVAARLVVKFWQERLSAQASMVIRKAITYTGTVIIILMVMRELNFQISALLGAAGVVGIAIGFASQTSLSNLISGLFLISEKPFEVGDLISVGGTMGFVMSIDLLSIKLRTFDNRFIRIPNETIIKSDVTTVTRYPIRRLDTTLGVAYKEDIRRVLEILKEIVDKNPYALDEPEPMITFSGFGESQLNVFMGVWFAKEDFLKLRESLYIDIKERLDAEGIEIPFPHRTIYTGAVTDPYPIKHVNPAVDLDSGLEQVHVHPESVPTDKK